MPVDVVVRELSRGFDLMDQVSLTELRRPEWRQRLREHRKLRLVDRHEPVGVIVSPELWQGLQALLAYLDQIETRLEEIEIEQLWGHRLGHERRPAAEEAVRVRQLLRERG